MDLVFQASWPALWAALASPQGIIASCLFCLGVLGFLLLQDMGENLRVSLLSLALFGLIALCYAYLQFSQPAVPLMVQQTKAKKPQQKGPPRITASGIITRGEGDNQAKESGYIYIGRYRDKHWQSALFNDPTGPLTTGDVLQLNTARQMFACAPYRKEMLDLKFTYCKEVIGEAFENESVRVARPPIIVGLSNVWVYVTKVGS